MAEHKKILISVPSALLNELDNFAEKSGLSRNETVRIAIKEYVAMRRKEEIAKQLETGYKEMAGINSEWALNCLTADNQCTLEYEAKLAESNS